MSVLPKRIDRRREWKTTMQERPKGASRSGCFREVLMKLSKVVELCVSIGVTKHTKVCPSSLGKTAVLSGLRRYSFGFPKANSTCMQKV